MRRYGGASIRSHFWLKAIMGSHRELFQSEVSALCNVSSVFSPADMDRCHRVGQAVMRFAGHHASVELAKAQGQPAMFVYISDGWSAKVRDNSVVTSGDHLVIRHGHLKHELLLERGILRFRTPDGGQGVHLLFGPPRGLRKGRSSWNILEAASQFWPLLRAEGHEGWIISAYVQDGHLAASCLKLFRSRHGLFYDLKGDSGLSPDHHEDKDIVVGVRCRAHSVHNSLVWGMGNVCDDDVADDAFIALASLNNCSTGLFLQLETWLLKVVQLTERTNSREDVEAFWKLLGVDDKMLPLFVLADPWWNGSVLLVSNRLQDVADMWRQLRAIVVYTYRWVRWTTSRWCTAGRAGRFWVRSVALGLDNAVSCLLKDETTPTPLLSGYKRCDAKVRKLLTLVAVSAIPSERMLISLLTDDRFLRTLPAVEADLRGDVGSLCDITDFVWGRLGQVMGCACADIKHDTLFCALAMYGWICRDTLADMRSGLFGLVVGDVAENVQRLARGDVDCASDSRLQQIKRVLDAGGCQEHVVDMLELMLALPFSSTMVEEGHASGAVLRRHHKDYSEQSLKCRALLHQQRSLFRPCLLELQVAKLDAKINKLRNRQPVQRMGPRQAMMKRLVSVRASEPGADRRQVSRQCMRDITGEIATLDLRERTALRKEGKDLGKDLANANKARIAEREVEAVELQAQLRAKQSSGLKNHVSSARLTTSQLDEVRALLELPEYRSMQHTDESEGSGAPGMPTDEQKQLFEDKCDRLPKDPLRPFPWWCSQVCPNRSFWKGRAMRSAGSSSGAAWYLILFCKQSPYQVTFLELRERRGVLGGEEDNVSRSAEHREFDFFPLVILVESEVDFADADADIMVLSDVRLVGRVALSCHAPQQFERLVLMQPQATSTSTDDRGDEHRPSKKARKMTESDRDAYLRQHPWLSACDIGVKSKRKGPAPSSSSSPSSSPFGSSSSTVTWATPAGDAAGPTLEVVEPPPLPPPPEEQDDALLAVYEEGDDHAVDELRAERLWWAWDRQDEMDFYCRILGGRWTAANRGVAFDAVLASPRSWAKGWCEEYSWPVSIRFNYARYTPDGAHQLAREWCRRAQFFFSQWSHAEEDPFQYTQDHVDEYQEDLEWLNFCIDLGADGPIFAKCIEVRNVAPRLG